ncbi:hypothetical protein YC2023_110624 [Brassica napus]
MNKGGAQLLAKMVADALPNLCGNLFQYFQVADILEYIYSSASIHVSQKEKFLKLLKEEKRDRDRNNISGGEVEGLRKCLRKQLFSLATKGLIMSWDKNDIIIAT